MQITDVIPGRLLTITKVVKPVTHACTMFFLIFKEARNSFFWINVDFLDTTPAFQQMIKVYFLTGFVATAVTIATVMDNP